ADLVEVAAGLYGVPPAEFTAARAVAVRDARADGDRELARAVGALRKPSSAAAAVNLLVRERPEDLGALLDLGVRIREAQAALAGADLRALHAEQQRAVGAAADAALDLLGGGAGGAVRGQVEATLRAAMGDPDAAAAVATGLLVRDLFSSGFEPVDVAGAVAVPDAPPLAGAPGRRTPLRAVPAEEQRAPADEAGADGTDARPRRRRGRLLTAEEPEQPIRAVPAGRRGRVRVAEDDAQEDVGDEERAPGGGTDEPEETVSLPGRRRRGRVRVSEDDDGPGHAAGSRDDSRPGEEAAPRERRGRGSTSRDGTRTAAAAGREPRDAAARAEREQRETAARAERERRAEAEREARERRHAAAVRSADHDLALAREEADARRGARDEAADRLRAAEERAEELAGTVARARDEIERLRAALAAAEQEAREVGLEVRHARSARTAAARQAERADQRLRAAEAARDAL
ncbi:hypothetical protein, partial [Cellulomonas sp. IC4_254]|uniref:hypothetical protein n=1 Tax=Cellulomonas sp. IC4_254 TaxID=2714040 RepID=UPI00141EAA24